MLNKTAETDVILQAILTVFMSRPCYTDTQIWNTESTEIQIITYRQINTPLNKCLHLSLIYWKRGSIILYIANELSLFVKYDTYLKHMLGIEVN